MTALDTLVATYADGTRYAVCAECKDAMISADDHGADGWICDPCEIKVTGKLG
jgi:hypothetical protein